MTSPTFPTIASATGLVHLVIDNPLGVAGVAYTFCGKWIIEAPDRQTIERPAEGLTCKMCRRTARSRAARTAPDADNPIPAGIREAWTRPARRAGRRKPRGINPWSQNFP